MHDITPTEMEIPVTAAVMVDGVSSFEPEEISAAMGRAFQTLGTGLHTLGAEAAGPPRALYHHDPGRARFTVAFPIAATPEAGTAGDVRVGELPGGPTFRFTHTGPYARLRETYGRITAWMIEQGHMTSESDWDRYSPMWEEYVDDPDTTPPEALRTFIYLPRRGE